MTSPKKGADDARSRIIGAALDLFSDNGFYATTTRKIAQKADVNEVTLFRQFKNKMALFQEVLKEIKKIGFDSTRVEGLEIEPEDAIRLVVEGVFEIIESYPREVRLLNLALLDGVEGFEAAFVHKNTTEAIQFIAEAFKKLQANKKITSKQNPEILAQMLLSQAMEMATQRVVRKLSPLKDYEQKVLCEAIIKLFMS